MFNHDREEDFNFIYLTGATESKILVQELLKNSDKLLFDAALEWNFFTVKKCMYVYLCLFPFFFCAQVYTG